MLPAPLGLRPRARGAAKAAPASRATLRGAPLGCQVSGCATPWAAFRSYNQRARCVAAPKGLRRAYCLSTLAGRWREPHLPSALRARRLCEEHMRADSFSLGGEAQRFCQARSG